jgi:hypothetical protein
MHRRHLCQPPHPCHRALPHPHLCSPPPARLLLPSAIVPFTSASSAPLCRSRWDAAPCMWSPQFTAATQQRGLPPEVAAWRTPLLLQYPALLIGCRSGGVGRLELSACRPLPGLKIEEHCSIGLRWHGCGSRAGYSAHGRARWTTSSARHPGGHPVGQRRRDVLTDA